MRIRPGGLDLLRAARAVIDDAIGPQLGEDRRSALQAIRQAVALGEDRLTRDVEASASDLAALEAARTAMRGEVLDALPEKRRYDARLVAKAISVAAKELANGHRPERREYERLTGLLGVKTFANASAREIVCALPSLNERLSERIRLGEADVGKKSHMATLAHLEAITQEALSESNPTYRRHASDVSSNAAGASNHPSPIPSIDASLAAWSDVTRALLSAFPTECAPVASVAQRVDALLHLPSAFGDAMYASGNAAFATQADFFGYVTQRLAANPRVPMVAVEGAHLAHDLSVAVAGASAALWNLALLPFRWIEPPLAKVARVP